MKIVITAATTSEWMPCFVNINKLYTEESIRYHVSFHQSGVGMVASCFSLTKMIMEDKPDLIIQAGIAGCFDESVKLGNVFVIGNEVLGDMGVEEDGEWRDIFNLKLEKSNYPPYKKRRLPNQHISRFNLLKLKAVNGVTVNEISTRKKRIKQLKNYYEPVTESMEGAALHYVCRCMQIPFIQMRAISNYVGERNKKKWAIPLAIGNLNEHLISYIEKLHQLN